MSTWCSIKSMGNVNVLELSGAWRIANLTAISAELFSAELAQMSMKGGNWRIDAGRLEELDTAGAMLAVKSLPESATVELINFSAEHQAIFQMVEKSVKPAVGLRRPAPFGFLGRVGEVTSNLWRTVLSMLNFIGQTAWELLRALVQPRLLRVRELTVQLEMAGLDAIPIVVLVTFLIGIVVAYLSGVQLEQYGANVFVADGVSLAMVRELSPILVAIIVAGRSGSAFTAQIGSMKINEEVDAISTLGLSPIRVLVIPRLLALMLVMPILVFVGNVAGILGGMFIADLRLGVSSAVFLDRVQERLLLKHVFVGLSKAPVFAFFIATIGCQMGLSVENNARSVGINTTATVVRSIVVVILLNAAFAVVFSELGI